MTLKKVNRLLEGLNILVKYYPDSDIDEINYDAVYFGDQLPVVDYYNGYVYHDLSNISAEDKKRLEQLGWFVSQDNNTWKIRL
jgi:hypothetical protein